MPAKEEARALRQARSLSPGPGPAVAERQPLLPPPGAGQPYGAARSSGSARSAQAYVQARERKRKHMAKLHFSRPILMLEGDLEQASHKSTSDASHYQESSKSSARRGGVTTLFQPSVLTSDHEAQEVLDHFNCPSAFQLTMIQVGMSLGYSAYMLTSWVYVTLRRQDSFPVCSREWPGNTGMAVLCNLSILSFWTFPLICSLLLAVFFYRELLHTQLYYVMLAHRVLLDFSNVAFFDAHPVRFMLVFLVLSFAMYPVCGMMTVQAVKLTLPYWIPVASFIFMIYNYFDLESRLLSLSKFVEKNSEWAKRHIATSYFMRDYVAEAAYIAVRRRHLEGDGSQTSLTGHFIGELVGECERLEILEDHFDQLEVAESARWRMTKLWRSDYWVTDFLYTEHIVDDPTEPVHPRDEFRTWYRIYTVYSIFIISLLLYLIVATAVTHLLYQDIIRERPFTHYFRIRSVAPQPLETSAGAVSG